MIAFKLSKPIIVALSLVASSTLVSCDRNENPNESQIKVSDVKHTPIKRQSIGNCWLYATSTWAESMHLASTGNEINISESYWTYWDWYNKIMQGTGDKIETGGFFYAASEIIRDHGYMLENEFIPSEANSEMSSTQRAAQSAIDVELSSGSLKNEADRTSENVMKALDAAFKVNMAEAEKNAHPASELATTVAADGTQYTLADEISGGKHGWQEVRYPQLYGKEAKPTRQQTAQRKAVMKKILVAVNKRVPVIMTSMVEFAALNPETNATFEYALYLKKGQSAGQGGHMIVLEDYTVSDVPGVGDIGEGEVSEELKAAALKGKVKTLVVKNSWGTNRPDRGLTDGHTRFDIDFLNRPLPFSLPEGETDISKGYWMSALSSFFLPPEMAK